MNIQEAIQAVTQGRDLSSEEMTSVMRAIMTGETTPAQSGGFLIGLRMKGETVDEIAAAAAVMRELSTPVETAVTHLVDTCGTGGDASGTFNVSTASAFVVAAAGGRVAKHGNRSVSSESGSADVLEAAGVKLDLDPQKVAHCIEEVGVGFLFAPMHHSAMKYAIGPRKEMAVRTVFNLLGPLTNPARAPNQVLGVFSEQWLVPMAAVLSKLGSQHVLVVHGGDGLDEISIEAPTRVAELKDGTVSTYAITPADFGFKQNSIDEIRVASSEESLAMIKSVLAGQTGPACDIVSINAGAGLYAAGLSADLKQGVARASEVIATGKPADKLDALVELTNAL